MLAHPCAWIALVMIHNSLVLPHLLSVFFVNLLTQLTACARKLHKTEIVFVLKFCRKSDYSWGQQLNPLMITNGLQ
jgi:hypothetical protein